MIYYIVSISIYS